MLRLENIVKEYKVADTSVMALKGVSLSFRRNEFVSILGPSGCGKTTTLNIIGGLDKYTSGDLFINGVSTKEFNDRNWDVYRNHRVGFIFQAYNLIPHQTILENVELALTIAGIDKAERVERSKKALDSVGLEGQYNKRPNQLSGGQCQRVAIARALVNDPEILLADEPTGALDTQTSIQIMELIKKISLDRLVIMVTHNPELAEQYSTRIVRLLDGELQSDSNPFTAEEEMAEVEAIRAEEELNTECEEPQEETDNSSAFVNTDVVSEESYVEPTLVDDGNNGNGNKPKKKEKAKMSIWTAFRLSFKNLLSKAKRTIMIIIAGSIGIIGVATVLAVSRGVNDYIDSLQDDMLSGYPITVGESAIDYSAMLSGSSFKDKRKVLEAGDYVNVNSMVQYLVGNQEVLLGMMSQNAINKDYVDFVKSMPEEYYSAMSFDYGLDLTPNIYTNYKIGYEHEAGNTLPQEEKRSLHSINRLYSSLIGNLDDYGQYADIITSLTKTYSQSVSNNDYISTQYDVVYGKMPQNKEDILIVLDDESMLTDLLLVQLGYYSQEEFFNMIYDGLLNALDPKKPNYETEKAKYENAITSVGYPTHYEYEELLGKKFTWYSNDAVYSFNPTFMTYGTSALAHLYNYSYSYNSSFDAKDHIDLNICGIVKPKKGISYGCLTSGFLYTEDLAREIIKINYNSEIATRLRNGIAISTETTLHSLYGQEYNLPYYYRNYYTNSEKLVTTNPVLLGVENSLSKLMSMMGYGGELDPFYNYQLDARYLGFEALPEEIKVYPLNFEKKSLVTNYLDQWNDKNKDVTFNIYEDYITGDNISYTKVTGERTITGEQRFETGYDISGEHVNKTGEIKYQDMAGLIITLINTMIKLVTYALVAFTALSLVVSTIMVGIITYVSVVERVKEIGVIRSLGGRKKDVSHLFNAETFMIGFASGVFGICFTFVISLLANLAVKAASDGAVNKIAHLTLKTSIIMIVLSVILTSISGMLPARAAAKKNPVDALRSE